MKRAFILTVTVAIMAPYALGQDSSISKKRNLFLQGVVNPEAYVSLDNLSVNEDHIQKVRYLTNAPEDFKIEMERESNKPIPFSHRNLLYYLMNNKNKRPEIVYVTISKI
jgi:hypothetical protein